MEYSITISGGFHSVYEVTDVTGDGLTDLDDVLLEAIIILIFFVAKIRP
ncbi:MAG: hypothetical protein R2942_13695 [Ignavibacteria bacterium]